MHDVILFGMSYKYRSTELYYVHAMYHFPYFMIIVINPTFCYTNMPILKDI